MIRSPSTTPNLMLVLLQLMASSMPSSSGRAAQQLARNDAARTGRGVEQQRTLGIEPRETTAHQLRAEPDIDLGTDRAGLGEPFGAYRREAFVPPFGQARGECRRELLERRLDRA